MDILDKQLVDLLADDAWQSAGALAKQLSTSASTVRRKIKRLVGSGAIRIVALADPDKVGLPVTAIMALNVSAAKLDSVMQALENKPEVRWATVTVGRFDIVALLRLQSTDELFHFVQGELARMEGVKANETFICVHSTTRGRHMPL